MKSIIAFFEEIPDYRIDRGKLHNLAEIIVMSLYGLLCGGTNWVDIQEICDERVDELKKFLTLKNGVPSVCTFRRVMSAIDSKYLGGLLTKQSKNICNELNGKTIAIDGKTIRGSHDKANGKEAFHALNAFVTEHHTVIRQLIGNKKESEITMIPQIVEGLDIKGATITIDAIGCQTDITQNIIKRKADYLIGLKKNQPQAMKDVKELFDLITKQNLSEGVDCWQKHDKGHGRLEDRYVLSADLSVYPLESLKKFKGIKSVVRVNSVVNRSGSQSLEYRYYISSQPINAKKQGETVRAQVNFQSKCKILQAGLRSSSAKHSRAVFHRGTFPGRLFIRYTPSRYKSRCETVGTPVDTADLCACLLDICACKGPGSLYVSLRALPGPVPRREGRERKRASFPRDKGVPCHFVKGFRGINPRAAEAALRFIPRSPDYVPAPGSETAFSGSGMSGLLGISNGYAPVE